MRLLMLFVFLLAVSTVSAAERRDVPEVVFEHTILSVDGGEILAPMARKMGGSLAVLPDGRVPGWVQDGPDGYISFDADEAFSPGEGTIELRIVVVDPAGLTRLGNDLEALVSLYDGAGVPFFSIGINDHDLAVGSYQLHPVIMEDVFGGVGFPYIANLDGPLRPGSEITVTITWGDRPSGNAVFVNGSLVEVKDRKGPRNMGGPPGYEPVKTLGSFMHGFEVFDGRVIGTPEIFVVGRVGERNRWDPLAMHAPVSVAIKSVRVLSFVKEPQ